MTHAPFTFAAYEVRAFSTWQPASMKTKHLLDEPILNAAMGIAGEAGEVAELIKHMYFPSRSRDEELDYKKLFCDELGDLLYYITILGNLLDIPLETIARHNNKKLEERHRRQE